MPDYIAGIPAIVIHGGAGAINKSRMTPERRLTYHSELQAALYAAWEVLMQGGTAQRAVVRAVTFLEDSPWFNAGRGSVFTAEGTHEMDAALMSGKDRNAGAIAGVRGVKNPVLLAEQVMLNSKHILLSGSGAEDFARKMGIDFEPPAYFDTEQRRKQWERVKGSQEIRLDHSEDKKYGTVGAVAVDKSGNLAAATSTGGMTNKRYGRIGDSPILGAGTFADNRTCAVSCTGEGEAFMRGIIAYDLSCLMRYQGLSLQEAADQAIFRTLKELNAVGGLIAVDRHGNIAMPFNSGGMYRAWRTANTELQLGIFEDE